MEIDKYKIRTEFPCDVPFARLALLALCTMNRTCLTGHPRTYTILTSLIRCSSQYTMPHLSWQVTENPGV